MRAGLYYETRIANCLYKWLVLISFSLDFLMSCITLIVFFHDTGFEGYTSVNTTNKPLLYNMIAILYTTPSLPRQYVTAGYILLYTLHKPQEKYNKQNITQYYKKNTVQTII